MDAAMKLADITLGNTYIIRRRQKLLQGTKVYLERGEVIDFRTADNNKKVVLVRYEKDVWTCPHDHEDGRGGYVITCPDKTPAKKNVFLEIPAADILRLVGE